MEGISLGLPTLIAIAVYLAGINVLGAWLGRGQRDAKDYFLGSHAMPWWAVMASIVATETSALTFLSVPGDAYRTGFTFLQLAFGYLIGRIVVSALLLPGYFQGEITTAYALLERRFGVGARRFTSLIFMVTRVMAASVRLAVPAIPIALILGVPVWIAILLLAAATALYTYIGGIKAVIWIDLIQVVVYLSGATMALWVLVHSFDGGFLEGVRSSGARFGCSTFRWISRSRTRSGRVSSGARCSRWRATGPISSSSSASSRAAGCATPGRLSWEAASSSSCSFACSSRSESGSSRSTADVRSARAGSRRATRSSRRSSWGTCRRSSRPTSSRASSRRRCARSRPRSTRSPRLSRSTSWRL